MRSTMCYSSTEQAPWFYALLKEAQRPANLERILSRARHFAENLAELLIQQIDPIKKAHLFGAIFDRTPTYDELNVPILEHSSS